MKVIKAFWEAKEAKASAKKAEEELRKLRESHGQGGPFEEIPLVIVEYQCDGMDQGERWKPFTVRNLGAPAFSVQIQDVATDWGVVRFGLVPQLLRDEQVTVEAQVQSDAGTHRDFIRFLEDGWAETRNGILIMPIRVVYSDVNGKRFAKEFEIVFKYRSGLAQARLVNAGSGS